MSDDLTAILCILGIVIVGVLLVAFSPKRDRSEFDDDNDRGMW
jgi:FtsZ-interacting cell division protein ZipA